MDEATLTRAALHIKGDETCHSKAHKFIAKHVPAKPEGIRNSLARYLWQPSAGIAVYIPTELKEARLAISRKISAIQEINESIPFVEAVLRWWNDTPAYRFLLPEFFEAIGFTTNNPQESIEPRLTPTSFLRRHRSDVYLSPEPQTPPFDLETLIASATSSLTFLAQNQWHLTGKCGDGHDYWPQIESALRAGISIEIAAMGAGFRERSLSEIERQRDIDTWKSYQDSTEFEKHLRYCWKTLQRWSHEAGQIAHELPLKSKLHIVSMSFCPFSLTVLDRKSDDGIMILSPRTSANNPPSRPEFVFRKASNRVPFNRYDEHVDEVFTQRKNTWTECELRGQQIDLSFQES